MVIRVLAVPDYLALSEFDELFRTVLGWNGLGFSFHIRGQELTSFFRRNKPAQVETVIAMLTAAHPDQPTSSWDLLREVMDDGLRCIDQRLEQ